MTLSGVGCTAIRQAGSPTVAYLSRFDVEDCHFYGQLAECIHGNLIDARIDRSSFSYFGTASAKHRLICSLGSAGNLTNVNSVTGNLFFFPVGSESVYFSNGALLALLELRNNFLEKNNALPINLAGIKSALITGNWFEFNQGTKSEVTS
jgi:hypothetical protein